MKYYFVMALAVLAGCAQSFRGKAVQAGQVAKEIVDTGARSTKAYLDIKYEQCRHHDDVAKLDACLGPVASKPDAIDAAFEAVRYAQLSLYIALADGSTEDRIQEATLALWAAVQQVAEIIKQVREGEK